ncbi:MAG: hypothetical protein HC918_05730 [Oscillatoriales cyanobacterium SM2_1_8]|nr:hypothetical protein [Oscillatoriales cyanobacterium SM2_1_8]
MSFCALTQKPVAPNNAIFKGVTFKGILKADGGLMVSGTQRGTNLSVSAATRRQDWEQRLQGYPEPTAGKFLPTVSHRRVGPSHASRSPVVG